MKNLTKLTGIFVLIAITLFLATCDDISGTGITTKDPTTGLMFTLIDNGQAYSVSIGIATDVHIVIPLIFNDLPVKEIGYRGFYNSAILSVSIPNGVTSIGDEAFADCKRLSSITIPDSVTYIGEDVFCRCIRLTSITIPNSVTSIGSVAFSTCIGLTTITIPDSVTSIGAAAFYGCSSLTSITVHVNNPSYSSLNGILYNKEKTDIICVPPGIKGKFTVPNNITTIGSNAFITCTGLTSIAIPNSVISIGDGAFRDCTGLISIKIPDSVTSIGDQAFRGCTSLTSITIPNSVTSIGYEAFRGCTSLTSITIPDSVTSIEGGSFGAFSGWTSSQTIYIPFATLEEADAAWNTNDWSSWRYGCDAIIRNNAGVQVAP